MRRACLALTLLLAGCGGSADELPESVEAFERRLEAQQGVLHVVTDQVRFLSESHMEDLPPGGWNDEIWLDLGGGGWRAHRTTGDGGFEQVADARGVRTYTSAGFSGLDSADGEEPGFLLRPWRARVVVDPVELVRRGRLTVVGRATVRGRPAHIVTVDPDPSMNTRLYVARDDGDLLRLMHRRERRGRLRTVVQDYVVFEVTAQRELNLATLIGLD
jgi:hypothetical protein